MFDYTGIDYDFELLQGEVTTKFVEEAVVAKVKVVFFVLVPRQVALYSESFSVTISFTGF